MHEGSLELTHSVNDIVVDGDWAYIASSDNNHELMVINVNPGSPDYLEHPDDTGFGFNAPGTNDGTAVTVVGPHVFLGRDQKPPLSSHDLFILDKNAVVDGDSQNDGLITSVDLGLSNNAYVTGIISTGDILFVGMDNPTTGLKIFNISALPSIIPISPCSSINFSENSTGVDMSNVGGKNFVFTSNRSHDEIRVIYDPLSSCS